MQELIQKIKQCQICQGHLPLGPNPVFTASTKSKLVIIGQAPGRIVHQTGIPWNDKSGDRLRDWLDMDRSTFYDTNKVALVPMGFCYPGTGKSGDLPPRKECAPEWHELLFEQMPDVQLTLLVGAYAQRYYLQKKRLKTLTETVENFNAYLPQFFVLPHPSPRNNIWLKKNPWFERDLVPELKAIVKAMQL